MQKVVIDREGNPRFLENPLIRWMVNKLKEKGVTVNDYPWNEIADFDIGQFYQLIGYSVGGYCELEMVDAKSIEDAIAAAKETGYPWQQGEEAVAKWRKERWLSVQPPRSGGNEGGGR